jgi:DNA-binding beta-propeller fold protein YncE
MGSLLALALSHVAIADADQREDRLRPNFTFDKHSDYGHRGRYFNRINTLPNYINNVDASAETVSEIVAASKDGKTLVYTDGVREAIGFIDIANPYLAVHAGTFDLSGEPTSVAVLGNRWALVGVNTSESFTDPSGHLAVIDIHSRMLRATIELGGQPDSVSISPDGKFAAVAIENERDEDIEVDGVEGGLPQAPAGYLAIVDLDHDDPAAWGGARFVDLTGLAAYAPEDPEPEFVDINAANQAVVTMQENNHIAIVDLASGTVVEHFTAGSVDLDKIDAAEDDVIELTDALANVPREPDAVTWIPGKHGRELIATANEGDLFGGSRGFSVFDRDGSVLYDAGADFEQLAVRHGHYPEARSENKGAEPEAIEYARFGGQDYLFVGSERGSFVAVYTLDRTGRPTFSQLLPAPLGPEGLLAIPSRNLLIVSGETDDPSFGVRSSVMIYRLGGGKADYPQILSANDENGLPIAWSALLGMTAVAGKRGRLLGVWDSYYSQSRIFQIDASRHPAVITGALTLQGGSAAYDPEGIAIAPDGSYWIASEGNASDSRPNLLVHADEQGTVIEEIGLPAEIMACRALPGNSGSLGSGFEGVSVARTSWRSYALLVAQQRGWNYGDPGCDSLDDDPLDLDTAEPAQTRIWSYDPEIGEWDHVAYELEPLPEKASWVGLSEITQVPGGFIVIERDNRTGDFADLKTLVFFSHRAMRDGIVSRSEKRVYDMMPDMLATRGWITDKPEGVAVTWDGQVYVVTDNDGVDDWSGETSFLRLGRWWQLFR